MNTETAERLYKCRKAMGYSQEELAEKIGVSRQAISKWERGESSPDTDNLIALSRLYNITIDELINSNTVPDKGKVQEQEQEHKNESSHVSFKNGIHVHNGDDDVDIDFSGIHVESRNGDSVHIDKNGVKVNGNNAELDEDHIFSHSKGYTLVGTVAPILIIIAFVIIGFVFDWGWRLGWLILLFIPILESLISAVRYRDPSKFAYPFLALGFYLAYGLINHVWHPTWLVFLSIPLYYIIADLFKPKNNE